MPELTFEGEVREVRAKKLVTLDQEITARFNTTDLRVIDLAKIPTDRRVMVTVKWEN